MNDLDIDWLLLPSITGVSLVAAIVATFHIVRNTSGSSTPLWLLLAWLVPTVGPVISFFAIRNKHVQT